ncbi:MAG TPA: hypothetical protein VE781_06315 [Kineosporiaceae bacterium]|jgi:hypothetical protein|nr:hypothetical protein [Kineosporiaceae bacterium]
MSADPYEVLRTAERVADRLRMLGPRWAARDHAADAAPVAAVRHALQRLADAGANAAGELRRPVPDIGLHALADQVLVLTRDALAGGGAAVDGAGSALDDLRAAL